MQFHCPISGRSFIIPVFSGVSFPARVRVHPAVEYLTHNKTILRMGMFTRQDYIQSLTETELILATSALLDMNKLIHIHCPIKPNISLLREGFTRLYSATAFCASFSKIHTLPGYSIDEHTKDLSGLLHGWLEEIDAEKATQRKRYREEILSRMEDRFNRKLRKKLFAGKTLFHQLIDYKQLEWMFGCMGIPEDDWETYRSVIYSDVWGNIKVEKATTYLLEVEQYLEAWYSLNNHKPLLQKQIHRQISELLDIGAALPKEYYVKDAEGNIEDTDYGKLDSYRKVIKPKLIFRPIAQEITKAPLSDRPKREDYTSVREYAVAIVAWNRKNVVK